MGMREALIAVALLQVTSCGIFLGGCVDTEEEEDTPVPPCYREEPATVIEVAVVCASDRWIIQDVTAGWTSRVTLHMILDSEDRERHNMSTLEDYYETPSQLGLPDFETDCESYDEVRLFPESTYTRLLTWYGCDEMADLSFFLITTEYYSGNEACVRWGKDPEAYDEWGCEPITPSDTLLWTE